MQKFSDTEIETIYQIIKSYHEKYLEKSGVHLPQLKKNPKGQYSKALLTLVYLAKNYPNTRIITKEELTTFIKLYYPNVTVVQQGRHLSKQNGWFIMSGSRHDSTSFSLREGEYKLETLEKPYPDFTAERRKEYITIVDWEKLKKRYKNKCACCGSEENKPHRYDKNRITKLQKGHMNPNKPLEPGNIIPQCESCNQTDKDFWIYNENGRVIGIANSKVIDKCSKKIKKEIYQRLFNEFEGRKPKN